MITHETSMKYFCVHSCTHTMNTAEALTNSRWWPLTPFSDKIWQRATKWRDRSDNNGQPNAKTALTIGNPVQGQIQEQFTYYSDSSGKRQPILVTKLTSTPIAATGLTQTLEYSGILVLIPDLTIVDLELIRDLTMGKLVPIPDPINGWTCSNVRCS